MAELQEGKAAPDFNLPTTTGNIKLSDFKGKNNIILYFYPKDDTPGCTKEACDFRDSIKKIEQTDAVILGVSVDSLASHQKFKDKYKLPFALVSDEGKDLAKKYGVWKEKSFMGKRYMGVERTTFVIDKEGKIRKIFLKVKVLGHSKEVMEMLKGL